MFKFACSRDYDKPAYCDSDGEEAGEGMECSEGEEGSKEKVSLKFEEVKYAVMELLCKRRACELKSDLMHVVFQFVLFLIYVL